METSSWTSGDTPQPTPILRLLPLYDDPEIVLTSLRGGGEGSQTAVPVGEEILRAYFDIPAPGQTGAGDRVREVA